MVHRGDVMTGGVVAHDIGVHLKKRRADTCQYGEPISDEICAWHYRCSVRGHTLTVSRTVVYTLGLWFPVPLEAFLCAALLKSTEADPRVKPRSHHWHT
jgi:hypothetical protein